MSNDHDSTPEDAGAVGADPETAASDPDASQQDVDEAFGSILEGLRTTLPGTQALFGFLLILPFQGSFTELDRVTRGSYYTAFIAAALATVLLIAPSAHQRMRAPKSGVARRSQQHLRITIWVTIWGTGAFALALAAATYLVSTIVLAPTAAAVAAAVIVLGIGFTWFWMPLVTFRRVG